MKIVWYLEYCRKKNQGVQMLLSPAVLVVVLFVVSMLVEHVLPNFNAMYMRLPDMVKEFLCLPGWSRHLWINIWQYVALLYPFWVCYSIMDKVACSIVAEERLETAVYLRNVQVKPVEVMFGKGLFWLAFSVAGQIIVLLVNALFLLVLKEEYQMEVLFQYHSKLFLLSIFYVTIALFAASYKKREIYCRSAVLRVLLLPWLISRIPFAIHFFADILVATGRDDVVVDTIFLVAQRLNFLQIICPAAWCWAGTTVSSRQMVCAGVIAVLMMGMAVSIYTSRSVLGKNRK